MSADPIEIASWYDNNVVVQALTAAAYERGVAAGRAEAAAHLAETFKRIADSARQSPVSTPPEYSAEQHGHRVRAKAFERAAKIAEESP